MKKILKFLPAVMVCTILLFNSTETKAQDEATATAQRDDDNDDTNFGWIGLIGLVGLLGFKKRDNDIATRTTTTNSPRV